MAMAEKLNAIGEKLKDGGAEMGRKLGEKLKEGGAEMSRIMSEKWKEGAEVSRKMSVRMSSITGKMKDYIQVASHADKFVLEATSEDLPLPDTRKNLEICDFIEHDHIGGQDVVRAIKKRLYSKNPDVQYLALFLLETCVNNCEIMYAEIASEKVIEEMVNMIDDPLTSSKTRDKALKMIETWGISVDELSYLPVFEETYKGLKARGIKFPVSKVEIEAPKFCPQSPKQVSFQSRTFAEVVGSQNAELTKEILDTARNSLELLSTVLSSSPEQEVLQDELTVALVEECQRSQMKLQSTIESVCENDAVMFEALHINDELQRVFLKYEDMLLGLSPDSIELATVKGQPVDEKLSSNT